ncbi:hypothetical protein [Pseudorhodoplanes sp.]|uniref:hypothetical protein n=1 Tax=Pseudorhodoplanes sp. TaxID=1934341 RepID=UPI002CBC956D|nr:hypothetical protein [Pseudorhodoplanes sp.]HWV55187.1 hypothetical protein [Pseudorhodoplanes sp.]
MKTGSLGCVIGAAALLLATQAAQAQFFPFFQQPQQREAPPPPPPPQQSRPAPSHAPAKRTQPPTQQRATAPAQKPAAAAGPATGAIPYPEVRSACHAEIRSTCAGVVPGSNESVQCLRPNFAVHTPPCQAALSKAASAPAPAAAAPAAKPTEPAGTATAPRVVSTDRVTQPEGLKESAAPDLKLPAMRPTQEARWVNRYCKEDHSLLCQGVTFGQSRVLRCLLNHHSSLTSNCRQALAKR